LAKDLAEVSGHPGIVEGLRVVGPEVVALVVKIVKHIYGGDDYESLGKGALKILEKIWKGTEKKYMVKDCLTIKKKDNYDHIYVILQAWSEDDLKLDTCNAKVLPSDKAKLVDQIIEKKFYKAKFLLKLSELEPNTVYEFIGGAQDDGWNFDVATVSSLELLFSDVPDDRYKTVALKSVLNKKFVRAGVSSESYLAAVSNDALGWETFRMYELGADRIALQSTVSDKYIRAGLDVNSYLGAVSDHMLGWETFKIHKLDANKIALQSTLSGKYVRAGVGSLCQLAASSEKIYSKGWEAFELIPIQ
jgi:hypothetical protein